MEDPPPGQLQASGWKISSKAELSKQLYLQGNAMPSLHPGRNSPFSLPLYSRESPAGAGHLGSEISDQGAVLGL